MLTECGSAHVVDHADKEAFIHRAIELVGCHLQGRCSKDTNQRSVTVTITDTCPECGSDHIDMQALTFNKVLQIPGIADNSICAGLDSFQPPQCLAGTPCVQLQAALRVHKAN